MKVLVTGASSDIGLEVCKRYLAEGYEVLAHYRTIRDELIDLSEKNKSAFRLTACDFSEGVVFDNWLKQNREFLTSCDVFVHCAATLQAKPYLDVTADDLLYHFRVNVVSGAILMRELGVAMAERGWGRIVMLGSIGVKFGGGKESYPYSLSKHALEFIPGIWREWATRDVLVNTLRIGVTDTRIHSHESQKNIDQRTAMIPMKRAATPVEMAHSIYYYGSDWNTFTTGQVISVAGGE
ncbi:SDR family oxidoreductase [Chlorobium phaeovibrioides]|uniref:SDR family oxidoreductase n=1 Tax=Chlorobium phaeovibrioides TaxID=1094 RepID=A0A3S0N9G3_CHLPH|nr:SDR family oxidoreductase [Chlorobium phaeovibrioides]RTY35990.1 SDR family oxidoreductase [Chlorobium phaeovibrioides]